MIRGSVLFLLVFIAAQHVSAQERTNDTVNQYNSYNSLIQLQTKLNEFDIYRELNYMRMNPGLSNDPNTIWMWTNLSLTSTGKQDSYPGESPGNIIEPLHQQFLENSKLNPVRYVLGMAQTAAVGYLAYRHIKKYGLFK